MGHYSTITRCHGATTNMKTRINENLYSSTSGSYGEYSFPSWTPDETIGINDDTISISLMQDATLIEAAIKKICKVENKTVQSQAVRILLTLSEIIKFFKDNHIDLSHLPPLWASEVEDGSIILEWAFPDFRIGFGIEPNPDNTSWYKVANKNLGDKNEYGYLNEKNFESVIIKLFTFIFTNS